MHQNVNTYKETGDLPCGYSGYHAESDNSEGPSGEYPFVEEEYSNLDHRQGEH